MKKMKRLQTLLLSVILVFSLVFSACGGATSDSSVESVNSSVESSEESSEVESSEEIVATGKIYPFIDACEQGILSKEDIQAYVDRKSNSSSSDFDPDLIGTDLTKEIKETLAKHLREMPAPNNYFPNLTADDLIIYVYLGTFGNCTIFKAMRKGEVWLGVDSEISYTFYDITFTIDYATRHQYLVYEKNS
jgi:protein involved in sex pheromone biosynthesis